MQASAREELIGRLTFYADSVGERQASRVSQHADAGDRAKVVASHADQTQRSSLIETKAVQRPLTGSHTDSILQCRPKGARETIAQAIDIDTVLRIRPATIMPEIVPRDAIGALSSSIVRSTVLNVNDLRADESVKV